MAIFISYLLIPLALSPCALDQAFCWSLSAGLQIYLLK